MKPCSWTEWLKRTERLHRRSFRLKLVLKVTWDQSSSRELQAGAELLGKEKRVCKSAEVTHYIYGCYSRSKLYSYYMMYLRFPVSIFPNVSLGTDSVASAKQPWMLSSVISCLFNPISVTTLRYLCFITFQASSILLNYDDPVGVKSSLKCYSSQAIKSLFLCALYRIN